MKMRLYPVLPNSILTLELSDMLEFYLELKVRTQKLEGPGSQA